MIQDPITLSLNLVEQKFTCKKRTRGTKHTYTYIQKLKLDVECEARSSGCNYILRCI